MMKQMLFTLLIAILVSVQSDEIHAQNFGVQGKNLKQKDTAKTIRYARRTERSNLAKSDQWQFYSLYGGEMTSIAVDPSNADIAYVGTCDAGVFKTIDGGVLIQ